MKPTGAVQRASCFELLYRGHASNEKPCDHEVLLVIAGRPICGHHYTRYEDMLWKSCNQRRGVGSPYAMLASIDKRWLSEWRLDTAFAWYFVDQWWTEMRGEFVPAEVTQDLYRYYDVDGVLLYVGIPFHAAVRASGHRQGAGWWTRVVRMEVEHLPLTRRQLEEVERIVIRVERPLFNVLHNATVQVAG